MKILSRFFDAHSDVDRSSIKDWFLRQERLASCARQHDAAIYRDIEHRVGQLEAVGESLARMEREMEQQRALYLHEVQVSAALQEQIDNSDAAWAQHAPAFLNALSTIRAFAHDQRELRAKLDRALDDIEQIKMAIMPSRSIRK